jgi:hypothetical protein
MIAISRSHRAVDTLAVTAARVSWASLAVTPAVPTSSAAIAVDMSPFTRAHAAPRAPVRTTPAPPLTAPTRSHPIQSPWARHPGRGLTP